MAESTKPAIEVDVQATDNDSIYGHQLSTYSASLTSSVLDYRHENGRRYHAYRDGSYLLPNDEREADHLDMGHELTLTIMERKLFFAPIQSPQRVIDLGTGTGIWAIHFADQHPSAEVIGVDLSPIQPSMVPPNSKFLVDDIESEWTYTNPGGWVEFQDWDMLLRSEDGTTKGTAIEKYYQTIIPAFEKAGYPTRPGPPFEEWFREPGFVNIQVHKYRVPIGVWPKEPRYKNLGTWVLLQAEQGFEGAAMAVLTRFESWSPDEVRVLAAAALDGLFDFYVVYGQKPE
ncbi:hypothetical protein VTN77DRAFT_5156 [Rasamsonia byssochlamydoides]|uniref:uncharacterized protein n=1 Tax=Rasamsonia byssochlamydoides TaxID=89139 RepID=UPI0037443D44